jgi:hypothetical protein
MSDPLLEALGQLVPSTDGERGDWNAVLQAAAPASSQANAGPTPGRPRRLNRRQLAGAVVLLVALAVVLATPAFGIRGFILGLVEGRTAVSFYKAQPAPPEIKKQFLDLAIGAPAGMNPRVLPDQARQITLVTPMDQKRIIWVAPTRGGGFCSVGGMSGGCMSNDTEHKAGPVTVDGELVVRRGAVSVIQVSGHVFSPRVSTLTLEFADGESMQLPFVYISAPIHAGFYALGVPSEHQARGHWPTRVVARDDQGDTVGTATVRIPTSAPAPGPIRRFKPQPPRPFPPASSVRPSSPTQATTVDGITVLAGANGAVRVTAHAIPNATARLLRGRISVSCFRVTREFGIPGVRALSISGAFSDSIGLTLTGVGRPFDGCELDSSRGHRWPDPLGSHSPVEFPLTATGRAYFPDRAAARDLALFVRSGRMQKIRKEPGAKLLHDMTAAYGRELRRSHIRYSLTPGGITFTEKSSTGKLFKVAVAHGRITQSNIAPYSKVF